MAKAVFLDYFGTILQEYGPDMQQMIARCAANSSADEGKLFTWWTKNLQNLEIASYGDNFITEEEICLKLLTMAEKEFGLRDDLAELRQIVISGWMYAPIFTDVKTFLEQCGRPVYIVTNNSDKYVRVCLKRNDLHVNGIICGDMVRSYKPNKEIFEKALEVAGVDAADAVYIGDSPVSDVEGARNAGITPILLDRKGRYDNPGCRRVTNLRDALRSV
ncbi:MAG: HAD family hydrolase [Erysipelotrichaceae bacterium]|nr:HAD family hydrolase [Erysipelotrichaceae bacterium]